MSKKKPNVHVSPRGEEWIVQRPHASRASAVTSTQAEADKIGGRIAKNQKVDRITQGKDGRIVSHDSYGNDPCPPKDTEN